MTYQNLLQMRQNLHTHTTYCDGKLSAEEMIKAAIERGSDSLGFSEHSYVSFEDEKYAIPLWQIPVYVDEIKALREKYSGQIDIFLGMEQDYFTEKSQMPGELDYIIGAVHFAELDGKHVQIDNTYENLVKIRDEGFGGDFLAVAECYYATIAGIIEKTGADIVAHFDIIAKQNDGGRLFDETHPRYVKAALGAMDMILERCNLFEINTGAMYRKGNLVQYPSDFLLRELQKRGGEIILSSDSHDADSLFYKFDEMRELALSCGFKHIKRLTRDGFIETPLDNVSLWGYNRDIRRG